jgi:hypothetical protein
MSSSLVLHITPRALWNFVFSTIQTTCLTQKTVITTTQAMAARATKLSLLFAVLATLGQTAPSIPRNTHWGQHKTTGKAVYFITNEAENAVVAVPIKSDGSLSTARVTKTGGAGGVMLDAASGELQLPDGLASQSSLTVVGNVCGTTLTYITRADPPAEHLRC